MSFVRNDEINKEFKIFGHSSDKDLWIWILVCAYIFQLKGKKYTD